VKDPRTNQPMTCLSCHFPHGSQHAAILRANPSQALCVECHDPTGSTLKVRASQPAPGSPAKGSR
jgi:predicted CXXCH cytochrome family protein